MKHSDLLEGLDQTWQGVTALIADVGEGEWSLPTPCSEWDVHDLAAHLGAIESSFQGLPQPEIEPPPPTAGIDGWTAAGVNARKSWTPDQILDEVRTASSAQLDHLRALDDDAWSNQRMGPLGETDEAGLAAIRLFDVYLHLLDLRTGLGRPLDLDAEPTALEACVDRALDFTPWGAVKRAGLGDGTRIRLDLAAPGARQAEVTVEGGRGALGDPTDGAADAISGSGAAYMLVATGRPQAAEAAGGLVATGDAARQLVERYRIF